MSSVSLPRPAERLAIFSLLLVFLCGGVAGAMVMSFWFHPMMHSPRGQGATMTMSTTEWKEQLGLSEDQTKQLTSILDDFSRYYDNLLADGNSRIQQILTPEQKEKYERMMKEHRK
jgi:Spy/CpxP family protein refolding chaperone